MSDVTLPDLTAEHYSIALDFYTGVFGDSVGVTCTVGTTYLREQHVTVDVKRADLIRALLPANVLSLLTDLLDVNDEDPWADDDEAHLAYDFGPTWDLASRLLRGEP